MISCHIDSLLPATSNKPLYLQREINRCQQRSVDQKLLRFGLVISTGTFPSLPPVQPPPVHVCATESYDAARCTASLESAASALCRPTIYAPVAGEQKPPSGEASRLQAYRIPQSPNLPLALLSLEDPTSQVHTDTGQPKPTGCISSRTRTCKYYYFHR